MCHIENAVMLKENKLNDIFAYIIFDQHRRWKNNPST